MNLPKHIRINTEVVSRESFQHYLKQVHGNRIVPIYSQTVLESYFDEPVEADGSITDGLMKLMVQTADCIPVLLFTEDPSGPIAAVHAGWRGVANGIVEVALSQFPKETTHAWIGPSIGKCHFLVKQDLINTFEQAGRGCQNYLEPDKDQWRLDLKRLLIETQLSGIKQVHDHAWECTVCSSWPSYRREGKKAERIVSSIEKIKV